MLTRWQLVAGLPSTSKMRVDLTNSFLDELWDSLQHPPMSYLGDDFAYRSADGSNNVSRPVRKHRPWLMNRRTSCIPTWEPRIRRTRAPYLPGPSRWGLCPTRA